MIPLRFLGGLHTFNVAARLGHLMFTKVLSSNLYPPVVISMDDESALQKNLPSSRRCSAA